MDKDNSDNYSKNSQNSLMDNSEKRILANRIIHKKAQIGKGIVFLPVLLFIIMVLALYLFVATGALIKKPTLINPESISLTDNDILLKKVNISINGKETEMLVLDAYILFDNYNKYKNEYKTLGDLLKDIVKQDKKCLILAKGLDKYPAGIIGKGKETDDFYIISKINNFGENIVDYSGDIKSYSKFYSSKMLMHYNSFIDVNNDKKYIQYYYGECKI